MTRRLMWTIAAAVGVAAVVTALVFLRGIPGTTRPHEPVGAQAQALRQAFNAAAGNVRVVALVSPTCGACLRGAADMQTGVFAKISDPRLRGFIVWVPKLDGHENIKPTAVTAMLAVQACRMSSMAAPVQAIKGAVASSPNRTQLAVSVPHDLS